MDVTPDERQSRRQAIYWRLLGACAGLGDDAPTLESLNRELVGQLGLPDEILDDRLGVDVLLHRYPKLRPHFDALSRHLSEPGDGAGGDRAAAPPAGTDPAPAGSGPEPAFDDPSADPRRSLAYAKLLLNVFGPNTRSPTCSAAQYNQWLQDVGTLEQSLGYAAGALRQGGRQRIAPSGSGRGMGPSGGAPRVDDDRLRQELVAMESDLVRRMSLREVLQDDRLAAQLSPSLAVVEQLLYDKSNLSGKALRNARRLIRSYVDELAEVLKRDVHSAGSGQLDRSVPPKRVYRNLDLKRTVWKNLHHYNPEDGRLYVDRLYYRHTAQKALNRYLIVVVDQSGSMIDAMVQCAILASIFAGLPRVEVSLLAYDTSVIDLTPWVADPFESLMRTNLGGGTYGPRAMEQARALVVDPRRTTMVWISDFYDDRSLFEMIRSVRESGVHFVPVGAVGGSGYFSVDEWFRKQLKGLGLPILTGNIKKLIRELKQQLC